MPDNTAADADELPEGEREALELLERGTLTVEGRLVDASNATLFCTIRAAGTEATCVYKPIAGERPLWDFPTGTLAGREVAAYLVSRAAGWNFVPPTVMRDGPFGPGMCQLWIDPDHDVDLVALSRRTDHPALREMAVFDAVINNADRKIGHLLPGRPTATCTAATTGSASPRSTSCAPCSGSGAAGRCPGARSRCCAAWPTSWPAAGSARSSAVT